MNNQYTPEQIKDIQDREQKALDFLKELQLTPAAAVSKNRLMTNEGEEVWVDKVQPYLADFKYAPKVSEIQLKDL